MPLSIFGLLARVYPRPRVIVGSVLLLWLLCSGRGLLSDVPNAAAERLPTRKVIIVQGIHTEGFANCTGLPGDDRTADGAGSLRKDLEGFAGLNLADIAIMSYSGEYCDATNRFQPRYEKADTCDGVRFAANYLTDLVVRFLQEDPATQFDLIGHSLGGLVVSWWTSQQTPQYLKAHVHSVITLDSMVRDGVPIGDPNPLNPCNVLRASWRDIRGDPECLSWVTPVVCATTGPSIVSAINDYSRTTQVASFVTINSTGVIGDTLPGVWRDIRADCFDPLPTSVWGPAHGCVWQDARAIREIRLALDTEVGDEVIYPSFAEVGLISNDGFIHRGAVRTPGGEFTLDANPSGGRLFTLVYQSSGSSSVTLQIGSGPQQTLPNSDTCQAYGYRESTLLPLLLCRYSVSLFTSPVAVTGRFLGTATLDAIELVGGNSNNDLDTAKLISLPYRDVTNTMDGTNALYDPVPPCTGLAAFKSHWYSFAPTANGNFTFDTRGSNYDTVISLWRGTQGNLQPVTGGCNDDINGGFNRQSSLTIGLAGGNTFYIMVSSFFDNGGTLIFNATKVALPPAQRPLGPFPASPPSGPTVEFPPGLPPVRQTQPPPVPVAIDGPTTTGGAVSAGNGGATGPTPGSSFAPIAPTPARLPP